MALVNYPPIKEEDLVVTYLDTVSFNSLGIYSKTIRFIKAGDVPCYYEYGPDLKLAFDSDKNKDDFYENLQKEMKVNLELNGGVYIAVSKRQ